MTNPEPIGYYAQYPSPGDRDAEHLRLLSIFHYVAGGLLAFFGCFPIIHIVVGILMVRGTLQTNPPTPAGYVFILIGSCMVLTAWGLAICLFVSGRFLKERRHYMFSMVIAAISCLQIPFGTILGVFTIIVLSRPSVKMIYGRPT